jgi:hypothetical protein
MDATDARSRERLRQEGRDYERGRQFDELLRQHEQGSRRLEEAVRRRDVEAMRSEAEAGIERARAAYRLARAGGAEISAGLREQLESLLGAAHAAAMAMGDAAG